MIRFFRETSRKMTVRIVMTTLLILGVSALFCFGNCAEEEGAKVTSKEISGEVSGIRSDSISIIYRRNEAKGEEFEMFLDLDKSVRLKHVRKLKDIQPGDSVRVIFAESTKDVIEKDKAGNPQTKTHTLGRKATEIIFVKPKPEGLVSGADLKLKGMRGE